MARNVLIIMQSLERAKAVAGLIANRRIPNSGTLIATGPKEAMTQFVRNPDIWVIVMDETLILGSEPGDEEVLPKIRKRFAGPIFCTASEGKPSDGFWYRAMAEFARDYDLYQTPHNASDFPRRMLARVEQALRGPCT